MTILTVPADGPPFADGNAVLDLIGDAFAENAELVVVPAGRLPAAFFDLRSGIAGEIAQKFVNYRLKLAVVGDLSDHLARSEALQAFVRESNRGRHLWFVATPAELDERLRGG
jgi:hypothetical protein